MYTTSFCDALMSIKQMLLLDRLSASLCNKVLAVGQHGGTMSLLVGCSVLLIGYLALPDAQERAMKNPIRPKSTLPILRNTLDTMFYHRRRLHDWLNEECQLHPGQTWISKSLGRAASVVICSEETIEDVLRTQFENFIKSPSSNEILYELVGDGIFGANGINWLHQRKTASHLFSQQMMREIMYTSVKDHLLVLCKIFQEAREKDKVVDVGSLLECFSMDVFSKIGFGIELKCLEKNEKNEFQVAFTRASKLLQSRFAQPQWLWKLKRSLNIGYEKQIKQDIAIVNSIIYQVITESMEQKNGPNGKQKDLISLFLSKEMSHYNQDTNDQFEPSATFLRDMTINFMIAGRDTTSHSMSWFLIMMNRYPHVLEKIREEIKQELPDLFTTEVQVPKEDKLHRLVYLDAAIRECQRLYPVVAVNSRTAAKDTMLCDGTVIKKGTRIALSAYSLGRSKLAWGENADEFYPERWIDPRTNKIIQVSPFKFLAFHAGPRMCLGMKFAMLEMKLTLATLLSRFDLQTTKNPQDFTYEMSLTLCVKGPLLVKICNIMPE